MAAACDAGHPHHHLHARRDTTIQDPVHGDPTNYESRTDWQRALWQSRIDPTSKRYIKQLENLVVEGWGRTFESLWSTIEESLDRGLPITDDVFAEYVRLSVARQLGNVDADAWASGFNGLYVGAREHSYRLTGFDKREPRRRAQSIDTLEEQAQLARLRQTALGKVKSITDQQMKRDILEALSRPGAAAKNPTAMANEIIRQERRKLEEAIDDRKVLKEEIKSLYDNMLWRVQRITRTETANAYWLSTLTGYREQGFTKVKFNSHTAEQRTCTICLALDGTEHSIETLLSEGGRYPLSTLTHPQCRCVGAGAEVCTFDRGWVPIESVSVGDRVLDMMNSWSKVTQVTRFHKRHDIKANVPVVRVLGVPLTIDHEVWTEEEWAPAGEVRTGRRLVRRVWGAVPEPPATRDPSHQSTRMSGGFGSVGSVQLVPTGLPKSSGSRYAWVQSPWGATVQAPGQTEALEGGVGSTSTGRHPSAVCAGSDAEGRQIGSTFGPLEAQRGADDFSFALRARFQDVAPQGVGRIACALRDRSGSTRAEVDRSEQIQDPVEGYPPRNTRSADVGVLGDPVQETCFCSRCGGVSSEVTDRHSGGCCSCRGRSGRLSLAQLPNLFSGQTAESQGCGDHRDDRASWLDDVAALGARHPGRQDVGYPSVVQAVVEPDIEPPEVFCDIGTESHNFLVRAAEGGDPFGVHNCWPSPVISHVTLESMEQMYRDEPERFAPGQTVFDRSRLEMEDVAQDYATFYGIELHDVPVEHEDEIKETLDVIRATPYQQFQPVELRFVRDVGQTDEFKAAADLPEPVVGQVTAWTTPDNRLLVSQFSADDGNTISAAVLRGWAARVYDEDAGVRRAMDRMHARDEVGPANLSADTIETLLKTFDPFTMMRRQMVDEIPTVALEKRLREAPDDKLEKVLTGVGIAARDLKTILMWRRDRPVWTLDGRYVQPEGTTGSERNRFINRTAELGPRDMFVESATAYVNDPWGLLERDAELYGFLRDEVFDEKEFRNR